MGNFLTSEIDREKNQRKVLDSEKEPKKDQVKVLTLNQEPRKEPVKVLDYKTGTENRTDCLILVSPSYTHCAAEQLWRNRQCGVWSGERVLQYRESAPVPREWSGERLLQYRESAPVPREWSAVPATSWYLSCSTGPQEPVRPCVCLVHRHMVQCCVQCSVHGGVHVQCAVCFLVLCAGCSAVSTVMCMLIFFIFFFRSFYIMPVNLEPFK